MRYDADVVIVGGGVDGPFKDDVGTPREGRTVPYVLCSAASGEGEPIKATLAEGVTPEQLPRFTPVRLSFELRKSWGSLKLRTYGPSQPAVAAAA